MLYKNNYRRTPLRHKIEVILQITKEHVVVINFTLKDDQGQVLDSSADNNPLAYVHGLGDMIPGFEQQLEGKTSGDKLQFTIEPEQGYGSRDEEFVQTIAKSELDDTEDLEIGAEFEMDTDEGIILFSVSEIRDDEVVLDGNHPLAGKTLHFDVEVTEVRAATTEELDHGHAHGYEDHEDCQH